MQRLGRYDLLEKVGRGGMGVVYRAFDTALGRTVAVKTVRLSEYATPQEVRSLRERLHREARAAGALAHPNIVAVYDLGEEGDTAYIVMEYVEGRTLETLLGANEPPRPIEWYLGVLEDVAKALDYAHARGVYHRDIKPANIMVQDDGGVKVADFGIAKVTWTKTMTETGMVMGSPHYMAPEQLKGEPVSARTDQFALAAVAYTALTGRRPFDADTVAALFNKILHQDPAPLDAVNSALGPDVERVLRKAMAKDPAGRLGSCAEFIAALREATRRSAQPAPPATARPKRLKWLPLAAASVAAVVLLFLAVLLLIKSHQAGQAEIASWDSIKGRREAALFDAYLKEYPQGRFVALARAEIEAPKPVPSPAPPRAPAAREVRISTADGRRYVWIPSGRFDMGCSPGDGECDPDERPRHGVMIRNGFWMGQTEVTVGAYRRFTQATGRAVPPAPSFAQNEGHPVVNVTRDDALAYCRWAGGRVPTEAEWEYAARAGTTGPRYGELGAIGWYTENSGGHTHEVAQKQPNGFGLYDMLGNVWEWVADWYHGKYYAAFDSESRAARGPPRGQGRVVRGGCWLNYPGNLRASVRGGHAPLRDLAVGFRCVREVIP